MEGKLPLFICFVILYVHVACLCFLNIMLYDGLLSYSVSSAHTDCIVTQDREVADIFLRQVDRYLCFVLLLFGIHVHLTYEIGLHGNLIVTNLLAYIIHN